MIDPLSPNDNPLENTGPFGDPLLDAVEHNIENPPGLLDLCASMSDGLFMDDLAKQLGHIERDVEGPFVMRPDFDVLPDHDLPILGDDEDTTAESFMPEDDVRLPEPEQPPFAQGLSSGTTTRNQSTSKPPLGADTGRSYRRPSSIKHHSGGGGCTKAMISQNQRYCPDTHDSVDEQQCESCDKYRHWPEGTDEEPKECWHDWTMAENIRKPNDENDSTD